MRRRFGLVKGWVTVQMCLCKWMAKQGVWLKRQRLIRTTKDRKLWRFINIRFLNGHCRGKEEKLKSALKVIKVKTSLKSIVIHLISSTSQKYFHVCQYSVGRMRCHSWCFDESSVPYNDSDSRQAKRSFDSLWSYALFVTQEKSIPE